MWKWSVQVQQQLHLVPRRPLPVGERPYFHELHRVRRGPISLEHWRHQLKQLHSVRCRPISLEHWRHQLKQLHSVRRWSVSA